MKNYTGFEIAIIGLSGKFPGAKDVNAFWQNIKNGVESISFFSKEELLEEGERKASIENPHYIKANAYLKNKEYFDSGFFGYLPLEAKLMDPQMRILHECVWQVIEDAGYNLDTNKSRIGLFVGAAANLNWENFAIIQNRENLIDDYSAMLLSDVRNCCTRISYLLNLRGPSIYMNTACSTSLVTVHQACNSLLLGECNMAIAGGIAIKNYSKKGYIFQEGMIFSKDGHCRPFDAQSSGIVGGEGVGLVMLKRLKNAIKDEDHIYAVIKGTGINNDGNEKVGYTAPSIDGQTEAIIMARKMAKVEPESITYIEAHGTATSLGDPIEVEALTRAFGRSEKPYCALGSVKSNIGHLDTAAGIAGLIKTVLALKYRLLPPSLNFTNPNPKIDFEKSPFYVNTTLSKWHQKEHPLRAGVSSFGIGGTNVHLVLEEAPLSAPSSKSKTQHLLLLSAKTPQALERNVKKLQKYLEENKEVELADVAYTLQIGRTAFKYRTRVVGENTLDAIVKLMQRKAVVKPEPLADQKPTVVFLFSGQGSQYLNMCWDLYQEEAFFREKMDDCFNLIKQISGKELKPILFAAAEGARTEAINQTEYTQPILFAIEYALAKLMMHWGIQPDILLGHSIGEYTAACISGVFSLEEALKLVVKRGALMQKAPKGKMLSISISEKELLLLLKDQEELKLDLAVVNSSTNCVVAGENAAILAFKSKIENVGYSCKEIKTSHAFHSRMMNGILNEFEREVNTVLFQPIGIPFISNVSGDQAVDAEISNPKYWVKQLRQTVKFEKGIRNLLKSKRVIFVEIGPGKTLTSMVNAHQLKTRDHRTVNLIRHPKEISNDMAYLLLGIGAIWCRGILPDWSKFYETESRRKVVLPTYSFEKKKYPAIVNSYQLITQMFNGEPEQKKVAISDWFYTLSWKLSPRVFKSSNDEKSRCTILLLNDSELGNALQQKLKKEVEQVIWVKLGASFKVLSTGVYEVNPSVRKDIVKLYQHLEQQELIPDRLIPAWGVGEKQVSYDVDPPFDSYLYSILNIIQIHQKTFSRNFFEQITLLTTNLHDVFDQTTCSALKSLPLGFLKVLSQEFPSVQVNSVDIGKDELLDNKLIERIYTDINDGLSGSIISYQYQKRWEQIYDNISPKEAIDEQVFKTNGIYLITGGMGNLGLILAEELLNKYMAKVILTGRTILPERKDWMELLQQGETKEKQIIENILRLEKLNGEVLYLGVDITNKTAMTNAVYKAEAKFGQVNGVFHAAGIVKGASINVLIELTKADFEKQMASKVKGFLVLKEVMKNHSLDFCLLTSSLSTVLGGLRFGAYSTSNTLMNYYLESGRKTKQLNNWISVSLDGLNFDLEEKDNAINRDEIFEVLEKTLSFNTHFSQVIVSISGLQARLDRWVYNKMALVEKEEFLYDEERTEEEFILVEQSLSPTEKKLMRLWQKFLGKTDLTIQDSFFEIGGDSLKSLTIIQRIQKEFSIQLTISEFFEKPTIQLLAKYIDAQQWLNKDPGSEKGNKIEITI